MFHRSTFQVKQECVIYSMTVMMIFIGVLIVIVSLLYLYFILANENAINIPGPNFITVARDIWCVDSAKVMKKLAEWGKEYGGTIQLNFGFKSVVVVSTYEGLQEMLVLKGNDFSGRPKTAITKTLSENLNDTRYSDLTLKTDHLKRSFVKCMKDHDSSKKQAKDKTANFTVDLTEKLRNTDGALLDPKGIVTDAIIDYIHHFLFSRETTSDEKLVIKEVVELQEELSSSNWFGKFLQLLPYFGCKTKKTIIIKNKQNIKWTKETLNEDSADTFVSKMVGILKENNNKFHVNDSNANQMIWASFFGSVSAMSATILALLNILAQKKDLQKKLYKECCEVVGSRDVKLSDEEKMDVHQAVILEILRYTSVTPIARPHRTTWDTELSWYKLPKDTEVWPNLWALHHDVSIWRDPYSFRPERYLNDHERIVSPDHPFRTQNLAFGFGPRSCPGERLAKSGLFLILAALVKNFEILPATTVDKQPSYDCTDMDYSGTLLQTPKFDVRFQQR